MRVSRRILLLGASSLSILSLLVGAFALHGETAGAASPNYSISGNTPGFLKYATDQGALDPSTVLTVTTWLKLHNTHQLDQLVASQKQKGNANYQKWLTQSQFNAAYGATPQELKSVTNFLKAHKLTVVTSAEDNAYVEVQGMAGDIEKAFHVQIDNFLLDGTTYYANTSDPIVNDASGAHIEAITGLDDYGYTPDIAYPSTPDGQPAKPVAFGAHPDGAFFESQCFRGAQTQTFNAPGVSATYTGNRYGADINNQTLGHLPSCGYQPSELQTAYNMTSLYQQGLDGTGQTVVIIDAFGSPTIQNDAEVFSQLYGLPDLTSRNFHVYQAPGIVTHKPCTKRNCPGAWASEVTMDVEWVHAMAPGAQIGLVIAPGQTALFQALNWAVVHHLGNTISNSWGLAEAFLSAGPSGGPLGVVHGINRLLEAAAAQGIDVNFASGDFGDNTIAVGVKTPEFPSTSPFVTSIGGTSLALNPDNSIAWQAGWGSHATWITDTVDTGYAPFDPPQNFGFLLGSGGGTSGVFAKPSWQSSLPGAMRQVPDVSMLADTYTGVEMIFTLDGQLSAFIVGGTSLACPMFSGLMAIAAQKAGHALGQAAPLLYGMSSSHDTSTAIYDVQPVSSATNVTGSITDSAGTAAYSADQLVAPLDGTASYYSALYHGENSTHWYVLAFGTDTSLMTTAGWDNVTGVGTPNGANFVNELSWP